MTVKRSYLMSAVALLLLNLSSVNAAEQDTVHAIIPWEAEGRVFQVDVSTMMFLGAFVLSYRRLIWRRATPRLSATVKSRLPLKTLRMRN